MTNREQRFWAALREASGDDLPRRGPPQEYEEHSGLITDALSFVDGYNVEVQRLLGRTWGARACHETADDLRFLLLRASLGVLVGTPQIAAYAPGTAFMDRVRALARTWLARPLEDQSRPDCQELLPLLVEPVSLRSLTFIVQGVIMKAESTGVPVYDVDGDPIEWEDDDAPHHFPLGFRAAGLPLPVRSGAPEPDLEEDEYLITAQARPGRCGWCARPAPIRHYINGNPVCAECLNRDELRSQLALSMFEDQRLRARHGIGLFPPPWRNPAGDGPFLSYGEMKRIQEEWAQKDRELGRGPPAPLQASASPPEDEAPWSEASLRREQPRSAPAPKRRRSSRPRRSAPKYHPDPEANLRFKLLEID